MQCCVLRMGFGGRRGSGITQIGSPMYLQPHSSTKELKVPLSPLSQVPLSCEEHAIWRSFSTLG